MCEHLEFEASAKVTRVTKEGQFYGNLAVDLAVHCVECERPVIFRGMTMGVDPINPTTSADRREARLPARIVGGDR